MGSQSVGDPYLPAYRRSRATALMELTRAQLEQIRQVLEEELRKAYGDALDRGESPAAVQEAIAGRRRALEVLAQRFAANDPEHAVHDADEGDGVGQHR
jgi:outer membrane protein TolC